MTTTFCYHYVMGYCHIFSYFCSEIRYFGGI